MAKKDKKKQCMRMMLGLLWYFPILIMMISTFFHVSTDISYEGQSAIDQSIADWSTPFISEIYAVDKEEPCEGIDEPAIKMLWNGTLDMCVTKTMLTYRTRCSNKPYIFDGETIDGVPQIIQDVFHGKRFCGRKLLNNGGEAINMLNV